MGDGEIVSVPIWSAHGGFWFGVRRLSAPIVPNQPANAAMRIVEPVRRPIWRPPLPWPQRREAEAGGQGGHSMSIKEPAAMLMISPGVRRVARATGWGTTTGCAGSACRVGDDLHAVFIEDILDVGAQ